MCSRWSEGEEGPASKHPSARARAPASQWRPPILRRIRAWAAASPAARYPVSTVSYSPSAAARRPVGPSRSAIRSRATSRSVSIWTAAPRPAPEPLRLDLNGGRRLVALLERVEGPLVVLDRVRVGVHAARPVGGPRQVPRAPPLVGAE